MRTVKMGQLSIGQGMPKTCVPVVGRDEEDIRKALEEIRCCGKQPDLVEFRADWFEDVADESKVRAILEQLRAELGEMPLLFTFRTKKEGGERAFGYGQYESLLTSVAKSGLVDAVDVEAFSYVGTEEATDEQVCRLVQLIQDNGCVVVGSNHDFQATPARDEIVRRLRRMQQMGMDIVKVAVMPNCIQDVLALLSATAEASCDDAMCPVITMSMSAQGVISRLSGEVFGSAVTFASVGQESAPGQIALGEMQDLLQAIHNVL